MTLFRLTMPYFRKRSRVPTLCSSPAALAARPVPVWLVMLPPWSHRVALRRDGAR